MIEKLEKERESRMLEMENRLFNEKQFQQQVEKKIRQQ